MSNYGIVGQNHSKIVCWLKEGLSAYRISKNIGCSKTSVLRYIKQKNLKNKNKKKADNNNLLKDKTDLVVKLHKEGKKQTEIAHIVGHSQGKINTLLKSLGLNEVNSNYSLEEDFFDKIDSEEKAYILGWFYSDGCVDKRGACRIQIQKEDEEILYKIKDILGYSGPIYEIPPPKEFPHRKKQVSLSINRKRMSQDLIKHGCIPNKSLVLTYPNWIDKDLEFHFLRGVFDGDGSITIKDGKYINCSITTTDLFNKELKNRLNLLGVDCQIYYRYEHTNTCSLQITKTSHSLEFLSKIYENSHIHLSRKRRVFDRIVYNTM